MSGIPPKRGLVYLHCVEPARSPPLLSEGLRRHGSRRIRSIQRRNFSGLTAVAASVQHNRFLHWALSTLHDAPAVPAAALPHELQRSTVFPSVSGTQVMRAIPV